MSGTIRTTDKLNCFHCGTKGTDLYSQLQDRMFDVPGKWTISQCPNCGMAWLKNQPVLEDIPELYKSYHTHEDVEPDSAFKRIVKIGVPARLYGYSPDIAHSRLAALLTCAIGPLREVAAHSVMWQHAKADGKILDLGCGAGAMLFHMQTLGWQVFGTEPDPKAVDTAKKLLQTDTIFSGFLEDAAFAENTFDALISSHVIEHLFDPLATLKECFRVMKPGAQLSIATPNIESMASQQYKESWRGLEIPRHFYLFNSKSLKEMASNAGFKNIRILTPTSYAYPIWQASHLIENNGSLPGGEIKNTSSILKLRALLFWAWEYLKTQTGSACGEELVLIANKP